MVAGSDGGRCVSGVESLCSRWRKVEISQSIGLVGVTVQELVISY